MYVLIFTILVVNKTGIPGFNIEHISKFQVVAECEKAKDSMQGYMDRLVAENKMFPGVFECRKVQ